MKTIFEEMGGTYRQVGDYFIPNLILSDDGNYQIGKYGRMHCSYLKEYRKILYNNYVLEGTLLSIWLKSIKPATSALKTSFPLWQSKKA